MSKYLHFYTRICTMPTPLQLLCKIKNTLKTSVEAVADVVKLAKQIQGFSSKKLFKFLLLIYLCIVALLRLKRTK